MNADHLVIVTEHLNESALAWLSDRCRVERLNADSPRFASLLENAAALVVRTYTNVNRSMLDGAPNLRVVGRAGAGLDNIDLATCNARSIKVVYTPDANTQAVVEYVFRLLLDQARPIHHLTEPVSSEVWKQLRAETVGARQLADMTLGIMGLGRIGKRIAQVGRAFGMRTIYCDIETIPADDRQGAEPVTVDELFMQADVLSIHIDGRPENRLAVNEQLIRLMKPHVIFINTSRGFVIDHDALASFLSDTPAAAALLDVHDPEPIDAANPLLTVPNATLLPHLASRTEMAMENMSWVVKDVWAVLEGRSPRWPA